MLECSWCHKEGHEQPECPIFPTPICNRCGGVGHSDRECPTGTPTPTPHELRPALERIALELEIANRFRMFELYGRSLAHDSKHEDAVEAACLELNAALARRVP